MSLLTIYAQVSLWNDVYWVVGCSVLNGSFQNSHPRRICEFLYQQLTWRCDQVKINSLLMGPYSNIIDALRGWGIFRYRDTDVCRDQHVTMEKETKVVYLWVNQYPELSEIGNQEKVGKGTFVRASRVNINFAVTWFVFLYLTSRVMRQYNSAALNYQNYGSLWTLS